MARLPKAVTRHDLDRLIVGNQVFIMAALAGLADLSPAQKLDARIEETRVWWRSHFSEEVTVAPPKED
jgi:hypothetical protein